MIASLPDNLRRFLLLSTASLIVGSAPLYALQEADDEETSQETEQPAETAEATSEATSEVVKKSDESRSLFFLGVRPELKRQQGPAIGKPTSILPRPFVPRGSVKVPEAPQLSSELENSLKASDGAELVPGAIDAPADQVAADNAVLSAIDVAAAPQDEAIDPDAAGTFPLAEGLLEAGALERLDPSGVAVEGADPRYSNGLWQGYERAQVLARLGEFAEISGSPSLAQIANKVALSGTVFEGEASDEEVLAFIEARLSLLMQLGNSEGYADLLNALPSSYDWTALSRHYTNAFLLDGKIGDACSLAAAQRESDDDAYWLRMVAFCEAARGNRVGVDFQLGILEEVSDIQPTFYQLIDQILVEAEQPPGAALPATVTLPASLRIDVLEATMARLARVQVPELSRQAVNPVAIGLMLSLPGVSDEAKIELMGLAVRRGWASGGLFAAFAKGLKSDPEQEQAALQLGTEDDRFNIDAVLAHMAARPAAGPDRAEALKRAWARAIKNTYSPVAGEGLLELTDDVAPNALSGGVMARAALISGEADVAAQWFLALRSQPAGDNPDTDAALISLAPLMTIAAPEGVPALSPELLERWWQSQSVRADRFERANMLFSVLEALGATVSDEAWGWLENGPVAFGGTVPAPAQWRRFLIAARDGDAPKALAFAFRLLSEGGTASVPASLAGSLVGTLDGMGMQQEARMIATEILISQGL